MATRLRAFATRSIPLLLYSATHTEAGLGPARFLMGDVVLAGALALAVGSRATVMSVAVAFAAVAGCVFAPFVASAVGAAAPFAAAAVRSCAAAVLSALPVVPVSRAAAVVLLERLAVSHISRALVPVSAATSGGPDSASRTI